MLYRALVEPAESQRARVASVAHGSGVAPQDVDAEAITEFAEEMVAAGAAHSQRMSPRLGGIENAQG